MVGPGLIHISEGRYLELLTCGRWPRGFRLRRSLPMRGRSESAWLQTITGRAFVYAEPVVTTEHLKTEVAPILSSLPRFGGHTYARYSVAQHSALCATAALDLYNDMELAAFCLLHDAHETWTGDIVSPMQAAWSRSWRSAPRSIRRPSRWSPRRAPRT